jgi:glucan phosphoethanolaminetransferase (alkaline phosphatase superfamily)
MTKQPSHAFINKRFWAQHFVVLLLITLTFLLIDLRPGSMYFIAKVLLFQESLQDFVVFAVANLLALISIYLLLFNRSTAIAYASAIVVFLAVSISFIYRTSTGYGMMYDDVITAVNNQGWLLPALKEFSIPALYSILLFTGLALLYMYTAKKERRVFPPLYAFSCVAAFGFAHYILHTSTGVVNHFPAPYRLPSSLLSQYTNPVQATQRQAVAVMPAAAMAKKLVLIVDESITGRFLSINGYSVSTTPFLDSQQDKLHNFGIATSYSNYSAGSNLALLSGLRVENLPDVEQSAFRLPNIFQYAKKAGYTTIFIDGQTRDGALQNYFTPHDLSYVDEFIQPANNYDLSYYERDMVIAELLAGYCNDSSGKYFVYVNKAGAHWPYARTYPADSLHYSPVLSEQEFYRDRDKTLNTYYNSLRWTVDAFWQKLMPAVERADSTVFIYTSDHGQNLSESGIRIAHASLEDTKSDESDVPLWLYAPRYFLQGKLAAKEGGRHHEEIFGTLLLLQGYGREFVNTTYGTTLFDPAPQVPRYFITGDVLGRGKAKKVKFESR